VIGLWVMTVWNIKTAHRRNLIGTAIAVITLSPPLVEVRQRHKFYEY
jgi:hypothetical protein